MDQQRATSNQYATTAIVVNDDPTQINVLTGLLRKNGIDATAFARAETALAKMHIDRPPDLIVTDLYMPGIDGWRFCRLLRSPEYEAFNTVPILLVSATFAGDHPERIAADIGADVFLPSPIDGKEFMARVRSLLQRKEVRRQPRALIVEDCKIQAGILKKAFNAHGYRTDTALTAREAGEAFAKKTYDVAVLDYHLPDGTGDDLLDVFQVGRPDCACLMMTADTTSELALSWMKRGASAYLQKPFEPEFLIELCARARRERALLRTEDLLEARTRELRESEMRYRSFFESIKDAAFVHELNKNGEPGHFIDVNEAACRRLGYTREELLSMAPGDITDPVEYKRLTHRRSELDDQGNILIETIHVAKDGRKIPVEGNIRRITYLGKPVALSVSRDITQRKDAEEKLKVAEDTYRNVFLNAQVGMFRTDIKTGMILDANNAVARFFGYLDREDLLAAPFSVAERYVNPNDRKKMTALLRANGEFSDFEAPYRRNDGTTIFMRFSARIVPERGWIEGVSVDITREHRAEMEKETLSGQLLQAQKMESMGRLAGGVAHDYNNMLGVILGHTELALLQADENHNLYADLIEIQKAAKRSADITKQLLAFARKQTISPKRLDLNDTVESILKMLRRLIGEDIYLAWQPGAHLWPVKMDPTQIDQILVNLGINARDAIAEVGKLTIETGRKTFDEDYCNDHPGFIPGDFVLLAVSDNGCGMDKETLDNLFEPFFTTKEVGKGTGLGLATVYGIVKQNNGFINVYSEPGQGTTFTIYLPRLVMDEETDKAVPEKKTAAGGSETILLVEDEPTILRMTRMMLERKGYTVLSAATPAEAVKTAENHTGVIDLLMTDVVMPEMNGRDLAEQITRLYPDIRLLFMSGYTANIIAHQGVLEEGVLFIQKPFSMNDLGTRVREALK